MSVKRVRSDRELPTFVGPNMRCECGELSRVIPMPMRGEGEDESPVARRQLGNKFGKRWDCRINHDRLAACRVADQ